MQLISPATGVTHPESGLDNLAHLLAGELLVAKTLRPKANSQPEPPNLRVNIEGRIQLFSLFCLYESKIVSRLYLICYKLSNEN